MHLGGNRAGMCTRTLRRRPQARMRILFGEIVEDRKRLPDPDLTIGEAGNLAGRRYGTDPLLEVGGVERDHFFGERNAGDLHGEPWPQRPRRVALVADEEEEAHDEVL